MAGAGEAGEWTAAQHRWDEPLYVWEKAVGWTRWQLYVRCPSWVWHSEGEGRLPLL